MIAIALFSYVATTYAVGYWVFRDDLPDNDLYLIASPVTVPLLGVVWVQDWCSRRRDVF
jgi:hypothetical protein